MPTALVVHAHPDDEVFATGAATSVLSEQGWYVVLRVATAGVHDAADHLTSSCQLLGIDEWDWLGSQGQWIDDGGLGGPRTPAAAEPKEIAKAIETAVLAVEPQLLLTVGRDGLTGHPDHIAVSRAVQLALRRVQCRALGARLRAQDVRAGEQLLRRLVDGKVGSGRVSGCDEGRPLEEITAAPNEAGRPPGELDRAAGELGGELEQRRRRALDVYYDGLGSKPLDELVKTHRASSDGLLLRAVFDAAGWQQDRFEELTAWPSAAPSSR